ncbi:hypothetical protein [Paenibacillus alvei]|uniref:hypothetical protein n=1 Tax=Paenibacillus alvei TaxID=44250 RepID=UPI00227FF9E7|nr:hypothetical protein [Paenibacillus alvei]
MTNTIEMYICSICNSYCDGEECFTCDEMSGVLTEREDTSEQDLALIKNTFCNTEHVTLYLSSFGDAPAEIATIEYETDNLFSLLQMNKFVFNDISAVLVNGKMRNCIGIAFLNPVEIQHESLTNLEQVYGIMIFIE